MCCFFVVYRLCSLLFVCSSLFFVACCFLVRCSLLVVACLRCVVLAVGTRCLVCVV